jgi:hypothetical protein
MQRIVQQSVHFRLLHDPGSVKNQDALYEVPRRGKVVGYVQQHEIVVFLQATP